MKKEAKVRKVMREFKEGNLKSSSGQKVKNPKQAIAIALSEASRMRAGGRVEKMAAGGQTSSGAKAKNPGLWSKVKSEAKAKFDVYPSAYANAWASKEYKKRGGSWGGKDNRVKKDG